MALFTTTDRDNVKSALLTAVTEGVASVSIGGQAVQTYSLDQLKEILEYIQADLTGDAASDSSETRMGIRMVRTVPPGAG